MNYSALEACSLFKNIPSNELHETLNTVSVHVQSYEKGETVFHLMQQASRIGIILDGRVQAQKPFPNGSQINVRNFIPGDIIGSAAAFSSTSHYPCDLIALEPAAIILFGTDDILTLMQKDIRILRNCKQIT